MSDRDMLDLLAAQAPTPRPGHVHDIVTQARRARRRRQATVWGASLGAVAVTAVGSTVVAQSMAGRTDIALPPTATTTKMETAQQAVRMEEAEVYASAIRALANEVREGGPQWPVLYVLDHTCTNIVAAPGQGSCGAQPLPARLRSDLTAALASYAPVQFVADGIAVTSREAGLEVINGGVVVSLGPIQFDGDRAQVPLSVRRNGLNGRGLTYRMVRDGQAWRVDGTVGPQWIS